MFGHQDDSQQSNFQADSGTQSQPGAPADTSSFSQPSPVNPVPEPLLEATADDGFIASPSEPVSAPPTTPNPPSTSAPAGDADDLLDIKQRALQQLSPLVGHLDQSPEEKFRTTMMMIQAADNQDLIPTAYEAANQISDEKSRAQALLDIVNEINYFTQH